MYLVPPSGEKLKWDVRVRLPDRRIVKVPGDRDRSTAWRIGERVDMLVKAKVNGDAPPAELKVWIDNMPANLARRLVEIGLLDQRRVDRLKTIDEQIDEFQKIVAARKTNTAEHAKRTAACVRRLFAKMGIKNLAQISEDAVSTTLLTMCPSPSTRRHYMIAVKDFAKWAARTGRMATNPLASLKPPGQYVNPEVERVPLTVKQFQALMKYMDGFVRYPHQFARWTAADRKLLYWTAVKTAFRKGELRSLRVSSLLLDAKPAQIIIRAANAKNSTYASVPIPNNLAVALKKYVRGRDADERLFPFPTTNHGVLDIFRRDLTGAGIKWDWGDDDPQRIDFHTLRSTAITWWLDVDGLPAKRVQILARLKTLHLVALYSRNLRLEEFDWLDKGPTLVAPGKRAAAG